MKPVVIIFTTSYRPFIGGAELAVENIAKRLKGDFDFFIITARTRRGLSAREISEEGVIIRLGLGTKFDKYLLPFLAVWKLLIGNWEFFPKQQKMLFWGVMVSYASIGAWFLKLFKPKIPFVLTIQEGDEEWKFKWKTLGMSRFWWRVIFFKVNFVTAISRYLLGVAREHGYQGSAEVVPNGAEEKLLGIERKPDDSKKIIFSASRLVRKNGLDILIEACAKIRNDFNFRVIIAGEGPERDNLERMTKDLFIEDRVKFLGSVPYEKLSALYREADIFVRPSRTEGLGNAFLEAMAAGLITIGTKVGGTSDFLYEGFTGFTAKPENADDLADAIRVAFLLTSKRREEITENARKMIRERFLWSTVAKQMKSVFIRVIGDNL